MIELITLYAKKHFRPNGTYDVAIYRDALAIEHFATFNEHDSNKPTRRNKYVKINGWKFKLEWAK